MSKNASVANPGKYKGWSISRKKLSYYLYFLKIQITKEFFHEIKKKEQRKEIGFIHNDFINKKQETLKKIAIWKKKCHFNLHLFKKKYIYITQMPLVFPVIMKKYWKDNFYI